MSSANNRARAEARRASSEDPTRSAAPWYLGDDVRPTGSSLSPDGRWLLVAVQPASHNRGRVGRMPHYVTVDGYIDIEEVRTRVGRNLPAPQRLWLLDLVERERHELAFDALPGIQEDPLAELKQAQGIDPLREGQNREVSVMGMQWQPNAERAAVMIRANDNKDRWIATLKPSAPELNPRHRLTDPAWINWAYNDFGWRGERDELWFLSEQSGYAHFYTIGADSGRARAHSEGEFEVMDPTLSSDGNQVYLRSNRSHPSEYDLYRLDLERNQLTRLSEHGGSKAMPCCRTMTRSWFGFRNPTCRPRSACCRALAARLSA
jgi:hypothetical protein